MTRNLWHSWITPRRSGSVSATSFTRRKGSISVRIISNALKRVREVLASCRAGKHKRTFVGCCRSGKQVFQILPVTVVASILLRKMNSFTGSGSGIHGSCPLATPFGSLMMWIKLLGGAVIRMYVVPAIVCGSAEIWQMPASFVAGGGGNLRLAVKLVVVTVRVAVQGGGTRPWPASRKWIGINFHTGSPQATRTLQ